MVPKVWRFHMKKYGLSFPETLKELASLAGITESQKKRIITKYDYVDERGTLLYQVCRYEPKDFRQRRPNGKGDWIWNLDGIMTVIYNLPQVLTAETVFVVEGEKDAEALRQIGVTATTNPMGASKWKEHFNKYLAGKNVVIVPDNDEPGRKHAEDVAKHLSGIAKSIKVVNLPGLPEKGDVSDWLGADKTKEDLLKIVADTPEWKQTQVQKVSLTFTSLADLFEEEEEKVPWLVDQMLPMGGLSIWVAKPKVGKTTVIRNLAFRVARGQSFLERKVTKGPVLYLALEEKRSEVKKHFRDMGAIGDEEIHVFVSSAPPDALDQIREKIPELKPVLIIIDPLFRLTRVKDSNDYAQVTQALEPLLMLARETGAHTAVAHHMGKGDREGGDSILGSTAIFGSVDTAIILKRNDKYRTIHTIQRYGQDLEETILHFDPDARTITIGKTKEEEDIAISEKAIVEHFQTQEAPLTEAEIMEAVEGRTGGKKKALRSLVRQELIVREGKGGKGDPFKYSGSLVPINMSGTSKKMPKNPCEPLIDNNYSGSRNFLKNEQESGVGKDQDYSGSLVPNIYMGTTKPQKSIGEDSPATEEFQSYIDHYISQGLSRVDATAAARRELEEGRRGV
jgi:hypothetical protein